MGRQHAVVPVAVRTRWRHQRGKAGYEFERREVQLVGLCPVLCTSLCVALVAPVTAWLAVLLGAAVDQLTAHLAQPIQRKRGPCAVTQQTLQPGSVLCGNAHAGVHREAAVFVAQHLLGLETLEQIAPHKGTQDATTQAGLCLIHGIRIHAGGGVEDDARW